MKFFYKNTKIKDNFSTVLIPLVEIKYNYNSLLYNQVFGIDTGSDKSIIFDNDNEINKSSIYIQFENLEFIKEHNFRVVSKSIDNTDDNISIRGVLGQDFFKNLNFTFDFKNNQLLFNIDNSKYIELNSIFVDKYILINTKINNIECLLLLDTASSIDIVIFENRCKELEQNVTFNSNEEDVLGAFTNYKLVSSNNNQLIQCGSIIKKLYIHLMKSNDMIEKIPSEFQGIIGLKMFLNTMLNIDYLNNKVKYTNYEIV